MTLKKKLIKENESLFDSNISFYEIPVSAVKIGSERLFINY